MAVDEAAALSGLLTPARVGVKGRTELSDDLSGFYRYERRVSANDGQDDGAVRAGNDELREVYVGLEGRFGSVSIGRHYGLYYDYIDDELDRHRSHYSDAIVFGDLFVPNSLTYRSPAVAGGSLGLFVEFNDADERGESIDERLELVGTYRAGALALHAGCSEVEAESCDEGRFVRSRAIGRAGRNLEKGEEVLREALIGSGD